MRVQAARFGVGALQDGVWYFAFGANLSTRKLTGSRGIEPLEALPGRLAGYCLAFNHRSGGWLAGRVLDSWHAVSAETCLALGSLPASKVVSSCVSHRYIAMV